MPLISAEQTRPPSEQLVDLHVYLVPTSSWNEQYRSVFNQAVNQTISAGFVRAHPEDHLYKLRDDVEEQLGSDIIPEEYVFLRSVGRCLTQVKGKQELILKVKNFLPPYNFSAEIFVLKSKREPIPLPDINRSKEHLLERKYSRTEGTQTTQSTNSGYHSDDWSANHVKPKSTDFSLSNQHSVAVKSQNKKTVTPLKISPIRKGPKGVNRKGITTLGGAIQQGGGRIQQGGGRIQQGGKISGKQFREMTNRRPGNKGVATARILEKVSENSKAGVGASKISRGKGQGMSSDRKMDRNSRLPEGGLRLGIKTSTEDRSARVAAEIDRHADHVSLETAKKQMKLQTREQHGHIAPHSSHRPSNQGDNLSSSPHDTHSSFSSSDHPPLPPIATHQFPTPPRSDSPSHKHETKSHQYDLTSRSQDSLPRFLSPEQNDHIFPTQDVEEQSPRSQAPTNNQEYRPPLSATPPDSPLYNVAPAHLTNEMEIPEPRKPLDKPGWRDTYTNGTNEDSGIAEPTPEEDLTFHQQHDNSIERSDVIEQNSDKENMIVLHQNHEEPHRTEQRRRYHHDDDDSSKANEEKTIHDFQMNYEQFLEDEENRKELEKLQLMREHNAQNVADVRRKKEEMQRVMSRRARELASQNSRNTKQYQVNDIEPYEGSSFAGHDNNEPEHLVDEQIDLNQESWSDGQPSTLTDKDLLQQLRKNEAEKNRMALEAIQIEDSAKEHSFLKKGKKRGIPSAVEKQQQDTPAAAVSNERNSRPGHQTSQASKNKDYNQLLSDLEEMRDQRLAIEQRREDLVRKAKTLQSRTQDRRNKASFGRESKDGSTRDYWKKQYFEEKKLTNPLEDNINKLRQQVEQAHRKLMTMMEGRIQAKKMPPSQKNNHKINIAKSQHDLEDLRRRVENAKMRLTSEMKLRNQAEKELRNLKNELTQKKIHVTLTRSQQLAILKESEETLLSSRTPQPHRTPQPRKTPIVPTQMSQSLTSHP